MQQDLSMVPEGFVGRKGAAVQTMHLLAWVGSVVLLLPDCSSSLTGPRAVWAMLGSSVSVECRYDQKYQQNKKYWCRKKSGGNCPPDISTSGSEMPVIQSRLSIRDNHSLNRFKVTMDDLASSDSGMYSCAVSRQGGPDLIHSVNVTVLSTQLTTHVPHNQDHGGSFRKSVSSSYQIYVPFLILICLKTPVFLTMVLAIIWMHRRNKQLSDEMAASEIQPCYWTLTGPEKVMRYEGESLSVQCHYEESFKQNTKFWCKTLILTLCSSFLIKSSPEDLVENGRVSIRDNKERRYFEITMDKLKHEDSGTYQCGIERGPLNDRHYIQVTVSPDPKQTSATTENLFTSPYIPASEESKEQKLHILMYCTILLFLLLIAAAVLLLIVSRKKKKGLDWKRKKAIKLQNMGLAHNTADVGNEQSVPHNHLGMDATGLYSNTEVHPENNYEELPSQEESSGKREKVSYATLNISDPQQQSIYANVGFVPSPVHSTPRLRKSFIQR
ncbi:polymeric immunoglobulin receptor-like [Paroedura picta]|uniref:polymeric immunoglobulin receptor-like n=1 Tax=Paroedura picta TaxID=143630 RepID=UPI00405683FB